jgi:adenylate cyclase class IV
MKHKEIEFKYWAEDFSKEDFLNSIHLLSEDGRDIPDAIYVVSCDDYYVKNCEGHSDFIRFRKGGSLYELTIKVKEDKNVVRKEVNINVSGNDDSSVVEFIKLAGYKKEFQVYKEAWIWHFEDCDVSYYTLSDGRSVIELEAVNPASVEAGVAAISWWEGALRLGSLKKEQRSLYEIFTEEMADKLDF